jgi:hypothetical protein
MKQPLSRVEKIDVKASFNIPLQIDNQALCIILFNFYVK